MHPILFHLGPYPVYAFGAMLGLSLLAGYQLCTRLGRRDGLSADVSGNAFMLAAVAGLLGARLAYAIADPEHFEDGGGLLDVQSGGLMGYGGIVLGSLAAAAYLATKRQSVRAFADVMAPAAAAGMVFIRLGSYLYGSEFGTRLGDGAGGGGGADAPGLLARLGTYTRWTDDELYGPPALLHHIDRYDLPRDALASYPTHPVQLYEMLVGGLLLGACVLWARRRAYVGQVAIRFCLSFAVLRFVTGYLRDDPDRGMAFGFSHTQLFCLVLFALSGVAWSAHRGGAADAEPATPGS